MFLFYKQSRICPDFWQTGEMKTKIKKPTLYLRSAYFIDNLKSLSGLGVTKIEERIRINQYDQFNLPAPSPEVVNDYFQLKVGVAFEPTQFHRGPPWLLAAELEFPGCAFAFFHPIFDLLFGKLESAAFWGAHFSKIPEEWIEQAKNHGWLQMAEEWQLMNEAMQKRAHRKKIGAATDPLSFIHMSLLRLPIISEMLFSKTSIPCKYIRNYADPIIEINSILAFKNLDGIAALFALALEGATIGDLKQHQQVKNALINLLPELGNAKEYRQIYPTLTKHIKEQLENMSVRSYSSTYVHGFSLPASWRALHDEQALSNIQTTIVNNLKKI